MCGWGEVVQRGEPGGGREAPPSPSQRLPAAEEGGEG